MVAVFIKTNIQAKVMNTTTMIPCKLMAIQPNLSAPNHNKKKENNFALMLPLMRE